MGKEVVPAGKYFQGGMVDEQGAVNFKEFLSISLGKKLKCDE